MPTKSFRIANIQSFLNLASIKIKNITAQCYLPENRSALNYQTQRLALWGYNKPHNLQYIFDIGPIDPEASIFLANNTGI